MMLSRSGRLFLCSICAALIGATPSAAATHAQSRVARADSTVVVLLGTGGPPPMPDASGPATAIVVGSRVFLFDAGAGVMRRMNAAQLPIAGPTALFITHLHSDHTIGLPDLMFTSWVAGGRQKPLEAYGPRGLQSMIDHIVAAWKDDIDVRTNGLEHASPNGFAVHVHEILPGVVYDSAGVKITAIPVPHGSWKEAYGYRIDTPDRSIVISGDTRYSPALEQAARGVDVLIHEVHQDGIVPSRRAGTRDEWLAYFHEFHTSDADLGKLAAAAKPKLLVTYHFAGRGAAADAVIAAIRSAGYQGRIVIGKDLDRF